MNKKEINIELVESAKKVDDFEISNFISLREAKYNQEEGTFDNVILIEAGTNFDKKRHYPEKTIKEAAPHFAGLKMYLNHETESEAKERPERDLKDWVSTVVESRYQSGKAVAKVAIHDPWLKERLSDKVAREHIGLSINSGGEVSIGKVNGETLQIVEAIIFKRLNGPVSVDWVTEAGARGRVLPLMESIRKEEKKMNLTELKKNHPDLVEQIIKESKIEKDDAKLQNELKEAQARNAELEKKLGLQNQVALVESMLKDKKLHDVAKARIKESFSKDLIESEKELQELVEKSVSAELDYINQLSEKGKINTGENKKEDNLKESFTKQLAKNLGLPVDDDKE